MRSTCSGLCIGVRAHCSLGTHRSATGLGPMCTDVWVPMVASPYVEMLRQMSSEAAALPKVGLAHEDDRHAGRVEPCWSGTTEQPGPATSRIPRYTSASWSAVTSRRQRHDQTVPNCDHPESRCPAQGAELAPPRRHQTILTRAPSATPHVIALMGVWISPRRFVPRWRSSWPAASERPRSSNRVVWCRRRASGHRRSRRRRPRR